MGEIKKKEVSTNALFAQANVQSRFEELLGDRAPGFIASVLQAVNSNNLLKKASPVTVMNAAATAAAMDLPINQNLGFAWIVPYKGNAQFQMGWKGFVQLALRTNQYKAINVVEIYENQFNSFNVMTEELLCDFEEEGKGKVVGYAAYLKLMNGFEKTVYWSKKKVTEHAKKYSKSYGKSNNGWNDKSQFDAMAKKTVLKNTISKWGIMSLDMQTAHKVDQAVIKENEEVDYVDNIIVVEEKKAEMKENNNETPELP